MMTFFADVDLFFSFLLLSFILPRCEKAEEKIKVSQEVSKGAKNQTASKLITVQVQVVYAGHKNDKYAYQVRCRVYPIYYLVLHT